MKSISLACAVLIAGVLVASLPAQEPAYDLIIRNGRVLDGSGNPPFPADVGVAIVGHNNRDKLVPALASLDMAGCPHAAILFIDVFSTASRGSSAQCESRATGGCNCVSARCASSASQPAGPSITTQSGCSASSALSRLRAQPGPWWRMP